MMDTNPKNINGKRIQRQQGPSCTIANFTEVFLRLKGCGNNQGKCKENQNVIINIQFKREYLYKICEITKEHAYKPQGVLQYPQSPRIIKIN